jgi:hypothetical protein
MNDFTKDELGAIVVAIHNLRLYKEQKDEFYLNLHEKIGSMIDNYCEHESMKFSGDIYGFDCIKCQKSFSGEHIDGERQERIINGEEEYE